VSSVVHSLPHVHLSHETVSTPWERKGAVMRELLEAADPASLLLVDGVKVNGPGGWALVLPDPEEPLTHVWAEAGTDVEARQLAQEYTRRIRQALR
jgi:mannose-1-phosphate guanylyltransferase/phosphomannomutase